jgi:hypothetical protein
MESGERAYLTDAENACEVNIRCNDYVRGMYEGVGYRLWRNLARSMGRFRYRTKYRGELMVWTKKMYSIRTRTMLVVAEGRHYMLYTSNVVRRSLDTILSLRILIGIRSRSYTRSKSSRYGHARLMVRKVITMSLGFLEVRRSCKTRLSCHGLGQHPRHDRHFSQPHQPLYQRSKRSPTHPWSQMGCKVRQQSPHHAKSMARSVRESGYLQSRFEGCCTTCLGDESMTIAWSVMSTLL